MHSATEPALSVRNMGRATLGETRLLLELQRGACRSVAPRARRTDAARDRSAVVAGQGQDQPRLADILGLSHRTVNKHLEHIFEKLGVETRAAAAALASGQFA